jgi:hypothetical protein
MERWVAPESSDCPNRLGNDWDNRSTLTDLDEELPLDIDFRKWVCRPPAYNIAHQNVQQVLWRGIAADHQVGAMMSPLS